MIQFLNLSPITKASIRYVRSSFENYYIRKGCFDNKTHYRKRMISSSSLQPKQKKTITNDTANVSKQMDKELTKNNPNPFLNVIHTIFNPTNATMTKPKPMLLNTSISTLCGHSAFVIMGVAYLTKDIFYLRVAALSSISLTMIFQYYRPQPLVIPLKWNALFWSINTVMATLLWLERKEAEDMPDDMVHIFTKGEFDERGMSRVEFLRFFHLGKKEKRKKGDLLKEQGVTNHLLCYIVDGSASIERDGTTLGHVGEHDFTGEIDFMQYRTKSKGSYPNNATENALDNDDGNNETEDIPTLLARESIVVDSDTLTLWVWEYCELKTYLETHRNVSNSLIAYISHEMREKLEEAWDEKKVMEQKHAQLEQLAVNYLLDEVSFPKNEERR